MGIMIVIIDIDIITIIIIIIILIIIIATIIIIIKSSYYHCFYWSVLLPQSMISLNSAFSSSSSPVSGSALRSTTPALSLFMVLTLPQASYKPCNETHFHLSPALTSVLMMRAPVQTLAWI